MRAVFQPPASIVSVVLAPAAVSSLASPTRPEWAVTPSTPADLAAAAKRRPMLWPFNPRKTSASGAALAGRSAVSAAAAPFLARRTSVPSPSRFVFDVRTRMVSAPGIEAAGSTSPHRSSAASDRRSPAWKRDHDTLLAERVIRADEHDLRSS